MEGHNQSMDGDGPASSSYTAALGCENQQSRLRKREKQPIEQVTPLP